MNLSDMLDYALNSKDVKNDRLDELLSFIPNACTREAIPIIQTGVSFFRNCSIHMTDWLCVDGDSRRELTPNNVGEQAFFSSDIRRCRDDNENSPHNRIFMSVTFLDKPLEFERYERLDSDPQEVMYEHARRHECQNSDFIYAIIGVINSTQQHSYVFFDTHETNDGELIILFYNSNNKYQLISIMLNLSAISADAELIETLGADESELHRADEYVDDDEEFEVIPISYEH